MQVEIYRVKVTQFPQVTEKDMKELELKSALEALGKRKLDYAGSGLPKQVGLVECEERKIAVKLAALTHGVPYRLLTNEQWKVLWRYFNALDSVVEFSESLIPPHVIHVYTDAQKRGVFTDIQAASHRVRYRDPLLIGWNPAWKEPFLLARWGDALNPWEWFVAYYYDASWYLDRDLRRESTGPRFWDKVRFLFSNSIPRVPFAHAKRHSPRLLRLLADDPFRDPMLVS